MEGIYRRKWVITAAAVSCAAVVWAFCWSGSRSCGRRGQNRKEERNTCLFGLETKPE